MLSVGYRIQQTEGLSTFHRPGRLVRGRPVWSVRSCMCWRLLIKAELKICNITRPALPGLHAIYKLTCSVGRKFRFKDSTSGLLQGKRNETKDEGIN